MVTGTAYLISPQGISNNYRNLYIEKLKKMQQPEKDETLPVIPVLHLGITLIKYGRREADAAKARLEKLGYAKVIIKPVKFEDIGDVRSTYHKTFV